MIAESFAPSLLELFEYLDSLKSRATVEELRRRLEALNITTDDVSNYVHFADNRYLRNLMREGPLYHALVMCWRSGQRSPIHDHAHSTCGLRILTGSATETKFEKTPCGQIKATNSFDWHAGDVSVSQDADIHQVSNLQARSVDLITLHVYSPPLLKMDTYSLIDSRVHAFHPEILAHIHGSGI